MSDAFDGDAISRAHREFLASLSDHPLAHNPHYSAPPPPRPDYSGCSTLGDRTMAQAARFPAALDWLLINYAYYADAFMGKGGIISLVDGKITTIASLRGLMQPYAIVEEGPRGGLKKTSVVDVWLTHPERTQIDAIQTCSDRLRPTFVEDSYHIFNRYWPPVHPAEGGDLGPFQAFLARLFPDEAERTWCWHYLAHKARRPWVPMIGVIMVAEEFGTGRGTLFDILGLLFGESYVVPCTFGELTGTSAAARFNARLADALFVIVNEAVAEDGEKQTQRRLHYDALKNVVEPSPTARRRFEAKGQHAFAQRAAASTMIATNHRDVVKLPANDRRFSVLTCGEKMTPVETTEIRSWMANPKNIGALYRALLAAPAVPPEAFNPFDQPPPFAGRLEMIGMAKSRIEDAYEEMLNALEGCPLFTMSQAQRLIGYFGSYTAGDWSNQAMHTIAKNAYRLHPGRIRYHNRKEIIYARTDAARRRWFPADKAMVVAALERTEKRVVHLINSGQDDIITRLKETGRKPPDEEEKREDDDE